MEAVCRLVTMICCMQWALVTIAHASEEARDALSFIVLGDVKHPLVTEIEFTECKSKISVDSLLFGIIDIHNDWNEAIWKSAGYSINDQGKIELRIACKNRCSRYTGAEGVSEMFELAGLMSGVDLKKTISLEIAASTKRVDRALADLKRLCPGVRSKY